MQIFSVLFVAALVFAICRGVDIAFQKLFRGKAEHLSGFAVRVSKRYGLFGVILTSVGIAAPFTSDSQGKIMLYGGIAVALMGLAMVVYYLSSGIFYNEDTFRISAFGKKDLVYRYNQIASQRLYVLTGGSLIVELSMTDGSTVSVATTMDGAEAFLDAAFAHWCRQRGVNPAACTFHDKEKSWWFPHEEEA